MAATDAVEAVTQEIEQLDQLLGPLIALSNNLKTIPVLEQSKVEASLAYISATLYTLYLKLQKKDSPSHPMFLELDRIRATIEKIKNYEKKTADPSTPSPDLSEPASFINELMSNL